MTIASPSPVEEALGHLGAALMQAAPSDDQIIMDHVRNAHAILLNLFREELKAERRAAA